MCIALRTGISPVPLIRFKSESDGRGTSVANRRGVHQYRLIFSLFACFILPLLSRANAATEIPFEHRDGLIWLNVSATGHAKPLRFLLDSGAGVGVIDLRAARALGQKLDTPQTVLGIGGSSTAYQVAGIELNLPGVALPPPRLAVDLSAVSAGCGRRIDGLLGADFFRRHIVQVDFRAEKIRLLSRGEVPSGACEVLPLSLRGDAYCVRLSVNAQPPGWVRVDTGCDSSLEWLKVAHGRKTKAGTSIAAVAGSHHSVLTAVQLGSLHLAAVPTGLHETPIFDGEAGLLGNGLLSRFTVTFDAARMRLLLSQK